MSNKIYCRTCGYKLNHLNKKICPECGRKFDPEDQRSYLPSRRMPISGYGFLIGNLILLTGILLVLKNFSPEPNIHFLVVFIWYSNQSSVILIASFVTGSLLVSFGIQQVWFVAAKLFGGKPIDNEEDLQRALDVTKLGRFVAWIGDLLGAAFMAFTRFEAGELPNVFVYGISDIFYAIFCGGLIAEMFFANAGRFLRMRSTVNLDAFDQRHQQKIYAQKRNN